MANENEQRSLEERFPECFNQTQIDPRTRTRIMPMQVIVIGMMRTGTLSIKTALERLGYSCYHMAAVINNPPDGKMWREAAEAKFKGKGKKFTREDWDQLLGHHSATIDFPSAGFMPELIEAYPEAKVIIAERNADSWYASCKNTIEKALSWQAIPLCVLDPFLFKPWLPMVGTLMGSIFGNDFFKNEKAAKQKYKEMHDEVRALVPPERRLEYKLGMGWEPMCDFLGKDIPKGEDFPRVNEGDEFVERVQLLRKQAWRRVAATYVPWVVGTTAVGTAVWLRSTGRIAF